MTENCGAAEAKIVCTIISILNHDHPTIPITDIYLSLTSARRFLSSTTCLVNLFSCCFCSFAVAGK